MADFGYDVAYYRAVDPRYGDLMDFDELISQSHDRGLKVIIDLVSNHTSQGYYWFRRALAEPKGPYRGYYLWRDPAPGGGPPNNWISFFGGPAWTLDHASGQYYLHLFLPDQPDLNWRNPAVRSEFDAILRFWLDRGVDGFRIDVAQALVKDKRLRFNPTIGRWDPSAERSQQWASFDHRHDILQPETLAIFEQWKVTCTEYDAVMVGETYTLDPADFAGLLPGNGLNIGFWFQPMHIDWEYDQIVDSLQAPLDAVAAAAQCHDSAAVGWMASSQDVVRAPSRFGGGQAGRSRSLLLSTLMCCLPGVPFLYQGEELGLVDGTIPSSRRVDSVTSAVDIGRDGCRTPIPWTSSPSFGFSTSSRTWLPDGGRNSTDTAASQSLDPHSWLSRYRRLFGLRHDEPDLRSDALSWIEDIGVNIIGFHRGDLTVIANTADSPQCIDLMFDKGSHHHVQTHLGHQFEMIYSTHMSRIHDHSSVRVGGSLELKGTR